MMPGNRSAADRPRWYERGFAPPYAHMWPHFVAGAPVNWLARHVLCPLFGHHWRQTWRGFIGIDRLAGRQCRWCWSSEYCPCLGCVAQRKDMGLAE